MAERDTSAARTYARTIGWLYLALGCAGVFTSTLWDALRLTPVVIVVYVGVGLTGIAVANRASARGRLLFAVLIGSLLLAWGAVGIAAPHWLTPLPLPLDNALRTVTGLWGFYSLGAAWLTDRGQAGEEPH